MAKTYVFTMWVSVQLQDTFDGDEVDCEGAPSTWEPNAKGIARVESEIREYLENERLVSGVEVDDETFVFLDVQEEDEPDGGQPNAIQTPAA